VETTGVDGRVAAGGGPGAAGEHAKPDGTQSSRVHPDYTIFSFFNKMLLHLLVSLINVVVVKNV
jgi:hypothetical protein